MRALLSVADRDGIGGLARELVGLGVEVYATDGTREFLAGEGIEVRAVSDLTNVPALVGGQVKTFHPAVYAGVLARRDRPEQLTQLAEHGIGTIDIVVVNVTPFAPEVGARLVGIDEAIEMIDVGGAALLSAAARNAAGVTAVADPSHYETVLAELREHGHVTVETRARLAAESFGVVAAYHAEIAAYLNQMYIGQHLPEAPGDGPRAGLRSAVRREPPPAGGVLPGDDAPQRDPGGCRPTRRCRPLVQRPARPRRGVPDGPRFHRPDRGHRQAHGSRRPRKCRQPGRGLPQGAGGHRIAAFGGIVGLNRPVDEPLARELLANSYEGIVAPGFADAAADLLRSERPNLELLAIPPDPTTGMRDYGIANLDFKRVAGGLLVEQLDELALDKGQLQVVTKRRPTLEELTDLLFAWRAVRHVRSNAIVLAKNAATVGIGAAQASRQTSVEIALRKAGDRSKLAVMAADAYFPFPDVISMAALAGVTAVIQPGGSIRDEMAIDVADRHHLAMVFTGRRHFRH